MHMSQPALSNHMAELEKETGIELINRDHPVSLTSAGKVFCEDSSKIVRSYDTMLERCRSLIRHAPSGRLIVKTPVVLGYDNGLTAIVRQYEKENPDADIRFSNGDGQTLLELIRCGAMDCGVFYGFSPAGLKRDDGAPIRFVTVATIPIAAIMRPDNRLASKEKLSSTGISMGFGIPCQPGRCMMSFVARQKT